LFTGTRGGTGLPVSRPPQPDSTIHNKPMTALEAKEALARLAQAYAD